MRGGAAILILTATALMAHADRDELSLHVDFAPLVMKGAGYGSAENDVARTSSGTAFGGRLGGRMTYGITDALALDVGAGVLLVPKLRVGDQPLPAPYRTSGNEEQTDVSFRGTVGATLHLGTKVIPTISILAGYQHRILTDIVYRDAQGGSVTPPGIATAATDELLVGVGLGLDFRMNATWVVGISFQLMHGFSTGGQRYNAIEVPLAVGGYWYPLGSSPEFLPGGKPLDE